MIPQMHSIAQMSQEHIRAAKMSANFTTSTSVTLVDRGGKIRGHFCVDVFEVPRRQRTRCSERQNFPRRGSVQSHFPRGGSAAGVAQPPSLHNYLFLPTKEPSEDKTFLENGVINIANRALRAAAVAEALRSSSSSSNVTAVLASFLRPATAPTQNVRFLTGLYVSRRRSGSLVVRTSVEGTRGGRRWRSYWAGCGSGRMVYIKFWRGDGTFISGGAHGCAPSPA